MASKNFKAICLAAFKCPVHRALTEAWAKARPCAWRRTTANTLVFDPDGAVDAMRDELGRLVRERILVTWDLEVDESRFDSSWGLIVRFAHRYKGAIEHKKKRFDLL